MKSKLMWVVYFITSFAAVHHGLEVFKFSLFTLPFVKSVPMLPQVVLVIFGVCGLVSFVSLFKECKECA